MRLFTIILRVLFLFAYLTNSLAQDIEGFKKNQPIFIGDTIYTATTSERYSYTKAIAYSYVEISYLYLGIDDNNVKVDFRQTFYRNSLDPSKIEYRTLMLPLNAQKQAYLRVKTLNRSQAYNDLIITVVDEFNRITVQQVKVIPTAGATGY